MTPSVLRPLYNKMASGVTDTTVRSTESPPALCYCSNSDRISPNDVSIATSPEAVSSGDCSGEVNSGESETFDWVMQKEPRQLTNKPAETGPQRQEDCLCSYCVTLGFLPASREC